MSTEQADPSAASDPVMNKTEEIQQKDMEMKEQEEEEEQCIPDAHEMLANAISGDKIKELLSAKGPTVKAVLLKTDGTAQEIMYDSTPSRNHVTEILAAPPSIIGQYPDLDVIIVGPRYEDGAETEFAVNENKLRFPFNNCTFHGDIFLYRFNQDCVCVDFTLQEYQDFAAKADEDIGKVFEHEQVNEEEDDYEDDEEYDEEEDAMYAQEFMREVIMNQVKKDYPKRFGREPTEQELEDMVNATLAVFTGTMDGIEEEEQEDEQEQDDDDDDEDDEEYNPDEDREQAVHDAIEDQVDEDELNEDKKDIEETLRENEAPLKEVLDEEEEAMLNSADFADELKAAIQNVQHVAKMDKQRILEMTKALYKQDTGEDPTDEMMANAFKMFAIDPTEQEQDEDAEEKQANEEEEEEEEEEIDPVVFEKEMNEALDNVRKLGAMHREELVGQIANTFTELNGVEPSAEQMASIFSRIKDRLADEACDEFLEANAAAMDLDLDGDADIEAGADAQEEDTEYVPNDEELLQMEEDKKIELLEELIQKKEQEEQQKEEQQAAEQEEARKAAEVKDSRPVKILVTPVKRRLSGSRIDIYLNEQEDANKTLERASAKFAKINRRAPDENDTQRLKEFLQTGMLFESQVNQQPQAADNDDDDDDEDDEDYDPAKDTFDYSRDAEDDMESMSDEQDANENDDTSNMIDID